MQSNNAPVTSYPVFYTMVHDMHPPHNATAAKATAPSIPYKPFVGRAAAAGTEVAVAALPPVAVPRAPVTRFEADATSDAAGLF